MAEKVGPVIPEEIHLLKVNLIKLNIDATENYIEDPIKPTGINFELGKEIAHNFKDKMARYRLHFKLTGMAAQEEELGIICEISLEFHFMVDNFTNFLKEINGETQVSVEIASSLMAIAYSTSRGIILEKTQNTFFNGFVIPVIDTTSFILKEENLG